MRAAKGIQYEGGGERGKEDLLFTELVNGDVVKRGMRKKVKDLVSPQ